MKSERTRIWATDFQWSIKKTLERKALTVQGFDTKAVTYYTDVKYR